MENFFRSEIPPYQQQPVFSLKKGIISWRLPLSLLIISFFVIGTAVAQPSPFRMNISSQPPTVETGGACIITVYAMGEHYVPLNGVDITLVSRIKGVTLSPDSGKTDESGRFESVMFANNVENPLITIAGAATTSKNFTDSESFRVDIPLQIPAWENEKPVAVVSAAPVVSGNRPYQVAFSAADSSDPDGMIVTYNWEFGDGEKGSGVRIVHAYPHSGAFIATVTVMDHRGGHSDPASVVVQVPEKTLQQSIPGNPLILTVMTGIGIAAVATIVLLNRKRGR
jgi:hypothetical protein